jgi:hypothetical protein
MNMYAFRTYLFAFLVSLTGSNCPAAIVAFTDMASFNTAMAAAGLSTTLINFDSATNGTILASGSTFQGISFTYGSATTQLAITNGVIGTGTTPLATTSGSLFLGNTGNGQLIGSFPSVQLTMVGQGAIGMNFIVDSPSDSAALVGEIVLRTTQGTTVASLPAAPASTLGTSRVYFLGLQNDSGYLSNVSFSAPNSLFDLNYRIDNIIVAVPEPGSLVFTGAFATWALCFRRRRATRGSR